MTILFLTLSRFSQFPTYKRAVGMGEALAMKGHEVFIAVLDCAENRLRMQREAPHCHPIWFLHGVWNELCVKILAIYRLRPDVVYSTSYTIHNLACLRWLFSRRIKFVLEFCELYSKFSDKRIRWSFFELLALFEYRHILCASRYLHKHFLSVCDKWHLVRDIVYSPYAYPNYLNPVPQEMQGDKKTIVFMAAMYRGYGPFVVMGAFRQLTDCSNVVLEMLGGGPALEEMKEWVREHHLENCIHVRGFVPEDDLNDYFSRASVFVSPMRDTPQDWARCPSKLFYYLPYNKPIVTCKIGNPYDVLGDSGYYYEPGNEVDMARSMMEALRDSTSFSYSESFIEAHSWRARAVEFERWMRKGAGCR